jgi:glucan-binding YG repeat protein
MLTGWQQHAGDWYYFQSSGRASLGWLKSGSSWYYLDPASGRMLTDWQWIAYKGKADWYYFQGNGSGRMLTGKQTINGVSYTFNSGGVLISPAAPVR